MYAIPTRDFHPPELAELATLVGEAREINTKLKNLHDWVARLQQNIEPAAWTARIEKALGNQSQIDYLKLERREALLTYEGGLMWYHSLSKRLWEINDRIFKLCGPLVAQAQAIEPRKDERGLRSILINACLDAEEVRRSRHEANRDLPNLHDAEHNKLTLKALQAAFSELAELLKRMHRPQDTNLALRHSLSGLYPTDPLKWREPQEKKDQFSRGRDLTRHISAVEFIDTQNTDHPALRRLAEILPIFEAAVRRARDAASALKNGEKGKVNERQYASRLVGVLDDVQYCGSIDGEQERQKERRVAYESARTLLLSEIIAADKLRQEVIQVLHDAAAEAQALQIEIDGDGKPKQCVMTIRTDHIVTVDKIFARRLALVNCLAADTMLREFGSWLTSSYEEYSADLTKGQGRAATEEAFGELAKYYGSFTKTTGGGNVDF